MAEKTSTATKAANEPGAKGSQHNAPPPVALGLASTILDLQRAAGNRSVGQLLGGMNLQPKLRIGPPGDAYEREADRVADAVLREGKAPVSVSVAGGAGVQRTCAECEEEILQGAQSAGEDLVQRQCHCQEEELVQRKCQCQEEEHLVQPKSDGGSSQSLPGFEARVEALRGSGRPLPTNVRSFFEPRFEHDFGTVRVHTGAAAGEAAQAVRARAFTVGRDIVFGAGEWSPGTIVGKRLLAHELTHVVQQTPLVARRKPLLQRAFQDAGEAAPRSEETAPSPESPEPAPETAVPEQSRSEPTSEAAPAEQAPAAAVVVEDDATEVGEGQMKKSDFLARLRTEVCAAADAGLAGTEHEAQGCPIIEFWFGYYEGQSAERFNRDLPRFIGEGPRPTTAEGYIALIASRVRRSVETWARTGEITGVPQGIPLPGMSLPGLQGTATALSSLGGVFFKALPGGPRNPGNPQALRAQLGAGRPLDGSVRTRMESAFGRSFSHVQVHTDGRAANLSHRLNARAFTVGEHVAFGSREYQPGTLIGDALIAHELAHVAQQSEAAEAVQPMRADNASYGALEHDADMAAVGAVASLWGLRLPGLRLPLRSTPRLSSGLRLQRCSNCNRERSRTSGTDATSVPATGGPPATTPSCGLTITGPNEVDHYCAAYVPSDAPACGVFPAPNITLTAAGGATGATLQWSIVGGGAKASIAGPSTGASVAIQGAAASGAKNDVTVQVTDGSCTATHPLTVREPTQMAMVQSPTSSATVIQNLLTYTVQDQFGSAMGAGICVDETVTVCANNRPKVTFSFGDAATSASGTVSDNLQYSNTGGIPASLCIKLDQVLTAGGCGPLLHNTILYRPTGITPTSGTSCAPGDPCP